MAVIGAVKVAVDHGPVLDVLGVVDHVGGEDDLHNGAANYAVFVVGFGGKDVAALLGKDLMNHHHHHHHHHH